MRCAIAGQEAITHVWQAREALAEFAPPRARHAHVPGRVTRPAG
jgi:hypothetical protein